MSRKPTRPALVIATLLAMSVATSTGTVSATSGSAVVARIAFGAVVPGPVLDGVFGLGSLWVSIGGDEIARIDPGTNAVVSRIQVGRGFRHEIAADNGAVWVTNPDDDTVSRIDPASGTVTGTFATGGSDPVGIALTTEGVWVSNHHADTTGTGSVVRLDPTSGAVLTTIPLGAATFAGGPGGMTAASGSIWVGVPNLGAVARIDPAANRVVDLIPVAQPCGIPAAAGAYVVIPGAGCGGPYLGRLDPSTRGVVKLNAGGIARFAVGAAGFVWVSVTSSSCPPKCPPSSTALATLDPQTGDIVTRMALPGSGFVAAGAGSIWAGAGEAGVVLRVQP